jgi:hypothetical protein
MKEAVENDSSADRNRAFWRLRRLRQLFCSNTTKVDPETGQSIYPVLDKQLQVDSAYQQLAALIQVDQRNKTPGILNPVETEFLLQRTFTNDLNTGKFPFLLYILGCYYEMYDQRERAIDCFRRVLSVRADFAPFLRCLTVKELRKIGMTTDDYVRYSQGDPRFPRFQVSEKTADVLCRQLFRVYTESPIETMLAKSVAEQPARGTNFGEIADWSSGLYRVTRIIFRGEAFPANETDIFWKVPRENDSDHEDWTTYGIAHVGALPTQLLPRRSTGIYALKFGKEEPLAAWASFHDGRLALIVSLESGKAPTKMFPDADSNDVRIEMQKVAELSPEDVAVQEPSGSE